MSKLEWLDDDVLDSCIDRLLKRCEKSRKGAKKKMINNVQDPFSALCLANIYSPQNTDELEIIQKVASASSGVSSAVGEFHQRILGNVNGFVNHDAGYDLKDTGRKILAEIKNKHNTLNSINEEKVIDELKSAVRQNPGYDGYLVIMIPKKPERFKKQLFPNHSLYKIDGTSFYALATGYETALRDLYSIVAERFCGDFPEMRDHCFKVFKRGMAP